MSSTTTPQTTTLPPAVANPQDTAGFRLLESIEKYTINDIKILECIALESEKKDENRNQNDPLFGTGRCSTALASLCFATIEQIGLIIRGDLTNATIINDIKSGNAKNAIPFFTFFSTKGLTAVSDAEIEAAYYLFRNKITHNLFPKHSLGVCQNAANPTNTLVISINGTFSLNVNFLSAYTQRAVPILKQLLQTDPALAIQVDNNIQLIDSGEEQDLRTQYTRKVDWQPHFTQWLPGVTF